MSNELSRRQILKLVGYASAGTAAVGSVPLLSRFFADKANAQTTNTLFVRENIYTFMQSPTKVEALTEGVRVMKARNSNDPTSWAYQANIHGIPTDEPRRLTAWNSCQHGTFFFLSWHRMYLYYFERILRRASGDPTLTLPYWDFSSAIPAQFRIPRNNTNPLFANRLSRVNGPNENTEPAPPNIRNYATILNRTLNTENFFPEGTSTRSFGGVIVSQASHAGPGKGEIERNPHDQIHGYVGNLMRVPETAAQDPIFWLHHANTDRLWEIWLRRGGRRANPTNNLDWMDDRFTFFDENGTEVSMRGRDVLDTVRQLNYRYDNYDDPLASSSVAPSSSTNARSSSTSSQQIGAIATQEIRVAGGDRDITFILDDTPLTLNSPQEKLLERRVLVESSIVTLNVIGVEYNPESSTSYDIYINLPQGIAPDPYGPNYAGVFSLFSLHQKGTFSLDITDVLSDQQKRNPIARNIISITFVPVFEEKPRLRRRRGRRIQLEQAVRFKGITIAIESL